MVCVSRRKVKFLYVPITSKVKSKRNKNVISVDGFMYIFDKLSPDETKRFWRCRRKDLSCPARIHTGIHDFKHLKFSDKKHCYDSEAARIEADTALTSMRQRAVLTMEHTTCVPN
ncbi:FLYWCH-type domain-containing protein [Aphis craccivora]|uniref:FLYWCH-type domain-containing protein n=1 Tax=Aphis craccivora TaxID=307492 RepID=A0A6G0YDH1_APHCR|nr:FLYWCH-type domain-containing protein [Aphis craccivora]